MLRFSLRNCFPYTLFLMVCSAFSQQRMITHTTPPDSVFRSVLMIENLSSNDLEVEVLPMDMSGQALEPFITRLQAHENRQIPIDELDPNGVMASLVLPEDNEGVFFGIIYQNRFENSQAYVPESSNPASLWRFFPHHGTGTYHGLAILNAGSQHASIYLNEFTFEHGMIHGEDLGVLAPGQKMLYLIPASQSFSADAFFEIISEQPLHLTALAGTMREGDSQMWELKARPNRFHPQLAKTVLSMRENWEVFRPESYQFTSRKSCFCPGGGQQVLITVEGSEVTAMVNSETGEPVVQDHWSWYSTIEDAISMIEFAIESRAQDIELVMMPNSAIPEHIWIDPSILATDDEVDLIFKDFVDLNSVN